MNGTVRFGVSINEDLLKKFDGVIAKKGYTNRSEAVRDLIREHLVEVEWERGDRETVGVITIVYDHDLRELTTRLTDLQHQHHPTIISTMHIHLDEHNCLEVLVARDKARKIKEVADKMIATRGVKYGRLTMATSGTDLL
ncbi:MAG TPA: nickel-responsive transcriptional regulator NikR [Candidatus Latescibacteria bacterium]|nr:nickel-responsive transcriptional regulator NikR [Candidatus Latescibacterota bacterium]